MGFCFFLYLWNHFVCELSLLPLITAPSPGWYHFFSKCEILPWNLSSHNSPWVWPGGLCNFCGLLQCKQEREPKPQFYNVQLACRKRTCSAASLGCLLLCAAASEAGAIPSALSLQQASGGPSSCWRSAGAAQALLEERFLLLPERWCEQLQCSHPTPSSKKNELQVISQMHSLDFNSNPVSSASGTDICSAVETIGEPISAQGISFLHPPTFST